MDSEKLKEIRRSLETRQENVNTNKSIRDRWNGVDLGQNQYDFRYLVFPETLGMDYNGHYMIININAPTEILNSNKLAGDYNREYSTPVQPIHRSKVDRLRKETGRTLGLDAGYLENLIGRRTRRIKESIALYMPSPLVFNHNNVYEEISLTALGGKLMVGSSSLLAGMAGNIAKNWVQLFGAAAAKLFNAAGQVAGTATQLAQRPINPMVEILFATTEVRAFTFELLLAPRNQKESETMYSIIKTLRFHGAPEYDSFGPTKGLLWIPPSEFDITFYNKGIENMNILRINTCVLERIEVDYSPTGVYSTFRNGHPVAARLSMGFRELEPLHKERIAQGF